MFFFNGSLRLTLHIMVSVYGEGGSSVRRPTAVTEAVSMVPAGVDSLSLGVRPKETSATHRNSAIGISFVASRFVLLIE